MIARLPVVVVCALAAAACDPQLQIILSANADLRVPPDFVKFQIRALSQTQASEFGPFDVNAIPDEQFADVLPGDPFFIDVIGCQTAVAEECVDPTSFVARGCSGFITVQRDEPTVAVNIELHDAAVGATLCPPDPPQT